MYIYICVCAHVCVRARACVCVSIKLCVSLCEFISPTFNLIKRLHQKPN